MAAGMARLEVTFRVDADGLLGVTARETTTGVEARVEVKASYGLSDEEVEDMLLAALEHGEEDFDKRRLVEARIEGEQVLAATRKALTADADLLSAEERERVVSAIAALTAAVQGEQTGPILAATDTLDAATHGWAGRRMDRAVARAIGGKAIEAVEKDVSKAEGVDAQVEAHARYQRPGATPGCEYGERHG
jgi:molecular chaperone HscA